MTLIRSLRLAVCVSMAFLFATDAIGGEVVSHDRVLVTFVFVHGLDMYGPIYRASTSDVALIKKARAELAKPLSERALRINGKIAVGDRFNLPWKWYFIPNEWTLADLNMELCDGQPSYVDENLDEWLRSVGSYCPWASRIIAEL